MKECSKCKIIQDDTCFYLDNSAKSKLTPACKKCIKEFRDLNREKIKLQSHIHYEKNKGDILETNKRYREDHKEESKEQHHQYYEKNKDTILAKVKEYIELNKDKVKEQHRQYYDKNKASLLKKANEYKKNRAQNDLAFKLRIRISTSIYQMLKNNNSSKQGQSILQFLPYSLEELRIHIESLFEPWMNWENWGAYSLKLWDDNDQTAWKWQLDHIKPHSEFNYQSMDCQEFRDCWALSNLRPLSAKQNYEDGVKRTRHVPNVPIAQNLTITTEMTILDIMNSI